MNEEKTITGKIESFKIIKSGEAQKEGRTIPWTLSEVIINGMSFRTFDKKYESKISQEGEWKYKEETREGPAGTYVSRTLIPLPKPGMAENIIKDYGQGVEILKKLKDIEEKLDQLLGVSVIYPKNLKEEAPKEEELPE